MIDKMILLILIATILSSTGGFASNLDDEPSTDASTSSSSSVEDKSPRNYPFYRRNNYYSRPTPEDLPLGTLPYSRRNGDRKPEDPTLSNPQSTLASTSYSVTQDSDSGTNVHINTKPVGFTVTGTNSNSNLQHTSTWNERPKYDFPKLATQGYRKRWDQPQSMYDPMSYKCVNAKECDEQDEFKSYYSVLNSASSRFKARPEPSPDQRRYDEDDRKDTDIMLSDTYHATFPFTVRGSGPQKDKLFPDDSDFYGVSKPRPTRMSTTNSPKWVRLQPLSNRDRDAVYDPFQKLDKYGRPDKPQVPYMKPDDMESESSKYSNRIGIELNPETFAQRWGYHQQEANRYQGDSRIPSWLENYGTKGSHSSNNNYGWSSEGNKDTRRPAYGTAYNGPTRDEDQKNWVKLEPIPVAGVSISKWVPKGSDLGDLPSTGNYIRDRPSAWWDRLDNKRPDRPMMGWGSSGSTTSLPTTTNFPIITNHQTKRPNGETATWNDIIYPDDPLSATASWEATTLKGISKFPSNGIKVGWKADSASRRPVATWSASGAHHNRFGVRRPGPSHHYSEVQSSSEDDPRWVLVSNSKRVTDYNHRHQFSDRHRYRPPIDRFRDDLKYSDDNMNYDEYALQHNSYRVSKDYKQPMMNSPNRLGNKDDIFMKLNATLSQLKPVLNHDELNATESNTTPGHSRADITTPSSNLLENTTPRTQKMATTRRSFISALKAPFSSLLGTKRGNNEKSPLYPPGYPHPPPWPYPPVVTYPPPVTPPPATTTPAPAPQVQQNATTTIVTIQNRPSIKPILAAVGAGMIPATMAAVFHNVMGRRRKRSVPYVDTRPHQLTRTQVLDKVLATLESRSDGHRVLRRTHKNFPSLPSRFYHSN